MSSGQKELRKRRLDISDEEQNEIFKKQGKSGLGIEIHPLLRKMATLPTVPKNHNPLKQNVRSIFDPTALNPYLSQDSISISTHKPRPLQINPQGKFIQKGNDLRAKIEEDRAKLHRKKELGDKNLLADENRQEKRYMPQMPPGVEWWDRPYLKVRLYLELKDKKNQFVLDSEEAPVSLYIQHPVPIPAPWENNVSEDKPMFLTKKEKKRIRRNTRQAQHKEKQDRIKLGLDPPPPPKVKLSNLMNVLTNEAIKDPTGVELRVRKEVEDRLEKHLRENEARKLTPEQRHEKIKNKHESDLLQGCFTTVYRVDNLDNPQHFFKVDMNAKQLELVGIVLVNPRFNLVIVEGGAKSIKFYKKLMMQRINWTDSSSNNDARKNRCTLVWEGQISELLFRKWSPMYTQNDDEAYKVLNKFGRENYWREAFDL